MADAALYPASIPQDGKLNPVLDDAVNAFSDDGTKQWAGDIAKDIQQHINIVNVSEANQAAGQQFQDNLAETKQNLVDMVKADPSSTGLALTIAPKMVGPLLHQTGLDGDTLEDTHNSITGHIQNAIANAAVTRMADFSADGAKGMLANLGEHIGPDEAGSLNDYIDSLHSARVFDQAVSNTQGNVRASRNSAVTAYKYGSTLLDPTSENVQFPQNYLANLVRNQDILPQDKQPLMTAYGKLATGGDVNKSDPYAVLSRLNDIVSPTTNLSHNDIVDHVGDDMRYVDALMLHGMNLQRTPEGQQSVRQLRDTIQDMQSTLASNGDRAGNVAFGRFVNWLLPAYRRSGMSGLNPTSDNYLLADLSPATFAPTHQDAVAPFNPGTRRPLADIFGKA